MGACRLVGSLRDSGWVRVCLRSSRTGPGLAKGRELGHTGWSFLDVAPPPGHTLHTLVAGPAGWGGLREGAPGVTCVLCPCLPTLQIWGETGRVFFPDIPVEPWAFIFFFLRSRPFRTLHFFLQTKIAILAVFNIWVPTLG